MTAPGLRLVVFGTIGQMPLAGVAWQVLHYLEGFRRLGFAVYYVEDTGDWPYDPDRNTITDDPTYAINYLGAVMARFGFAYRATRQPVVLDWWTSTSASPTLRSPARGWPFTTVANWRQSGKDVEWQGETYTWSKHHEFLKFLDLPRRSGQPLELALAMKG